MKGLTRVVLILFVLSIMIAGGAGCAGLEPQHQRNMVTNAGIWGAIGAGAGALAAAATGGKVGKAAVLGGLAGAALGAINTPPPGYGYRYNGYGDYIDCNAFPTPGERAACERGRTEAEQRIQYERERRAYQYGGGGYGYEYSYGLHRGY